MFNLERLFRILYYLTYETDSFLIAQDSYAIIRSCLSQLKDLSQLIENYELEYQHSYPSISSSNSFSSPETSPRFDQPETPSVKNDNNDNNENDDEIPNQYLSLINSLKEMVSFTDKWENILTHLLHEAESFWFCSPVDHTHCINENKSAVDQWRNFRSETITEYILHKIKNFQKHCEIILRTHFDHFLHLLHKEIDEDQQYLQFFSTFSISCRLANQVPLYIGTHFENLNHSFLTSFQFPATHFHHVDVKFAQLLGYSVSRLLAEPIITFGLNTKETEALLKQITLSSYKRSSSSSLASSLTSSSSSLASSSSSSPQSQSPFSSTSPNIARLFYRRVTREIIGVHWDIASYPLFGVYYARGVNITTELEISKDKQTDQIQRMLKLWLHNLRNASFEQQALVINNEVQELEKKIQKKLEGRLNHNTPSTTTTNTTSSNNTTSNTNSNITTVTTTTANSRSNGFLENPPPSPPSSPSSSLNYHENFQNIYDCIRLLIHSTKISVGLITQALNTKGLSQHLCVADFIQSIHSTCESYCLTFGVETSMRIKYEYLINHQFVEISDFSTLYMIGEITMIQTILDHIVSNAIRYSDPSQGVTVKIIVNLIDSKVQFLIDVCDSAVGGLPLPTFAYLLENLGPNKCTDERYPSTQPSLTSRLSSSSSFSPTPTPPLASTPLSPCDTALFPPLPISRASGIAHLVAKYHELTRSGDDFDMRVTTKISGSSFRIRFSMDRMAVPIPVDPIPKYQMNLDNSLSGKVLIVDDSMVIRKILSKYLDGFKCPHQVCIDGSRAWEWFQQNYQDCPGVISDLEMPVMGGEALIANIQTFCPGKPCFIVSGNEIPSDKLPHGVLRALLKPITAEQVLSILHEISLYSGAK